MIETAWVVKHLTWGFIYASFADRRKTAVAKFLASSIGTHSWRFHYRRGCRAVKVKIEELLKNGAKT